MRIEIVHFAAMLMCLLTATSVSAGEKKKSPQQISSVQQATHQADEKDDKDSVFLVAVNPDNRACRKNSSSLDISTHGIKLDANSEIKIDSQATNIEMQSRSFTQSELADKDILIDSITLGGVKYILNRFHFHTPSEHIINGKQFPMELQLVHQSKNGKLAVLVLLFEAGQRIPYVEVQNKQPLVANVAKLLAQDNTVYTYRGSLTTPPCTKNVSWLVLQQPIAMSPDHIADFLGIFHKKNGPRHQSYKRNITQIK